MTCANGYGCNWCKCDLENPLASFLFKNDEPSMRKKLLASCNLHPLSIVPEGKEGEKDHGKVFEIFNVLYGPAGKCKVGGQACDDDDYCNKDDVCEKYSQSYTDKFVDDALSLLPKDEFTKSELMRDNSDSTKKLASVLDKRTCHYTPNLTTRIKENTDDFFDNFPFGDPNRPTGAKSYNDCCPLAAKRKCTHKYASPWGKGSNKATAAEVDACENISITQQTEKVSGTDYCLKTSNRATSGTTQECLDVCNGGGKDCQCDNKCQLQERKAKTANYNKYPWRSFNDDQCFQKNTSYFGGWTADGCIKGLDWRCEITSFHTGDSGELFKTGCNYTSYFYGAEGGGKLTYKLIASGVFDKGSINGAVHGGGCELPKAPSNNAASNGVVCSNSKTIIKHEETCEASCASGSDPVVPNAVSATGAKLSLNCKSSVLTPASFLCRKRCQSPSTKFPCEEGTSIRFGNVCTISMGNNLQLSDNAANEMGSIADDIVAARDGEDCAKGSCSDPSKTNRKECVDRWCDGQPTKTSQPECTTGIWRLRAWTMPDVNIKATFNCDGQGSLKISKISCTSPPTPTPTPPP